MLILISQIHSQNELEKFFVTKYNIYSIL